MRSDACESCCAHHSRLRWKRLFPTIVHIGHVIYGDAEIGYIYSVAIFASSHQEVPRLHVSVDGSFRVGCFQSSKKLIRQHERRLEGELMVAIREKILKTRSEELEHYDIVVVLLTRPNHLRKSWQTLKALIVADLFPKESAATAVLQFEGNLLVILVISPLLYVREDRIGHDSLVYVPR